MKKSTTLIEQACFSLPEIKQVYQKLQCQVSLLGKSQSTLANYSRCLARVELHFNCNPLTLDEEQVLDYLYFLKTQSRTPSSSYFKYTVYVLRFAYCVMGIPQKQVFFPKMKLPKKLAVVLSQREVKQLLKIPGLFKYRLVLGLLYGCGLKRQGLCNIKIQDADPDRKMLHVREGKGRKDRYVPLGENLSRGIKTYLEAERPYVWLLNEKTNIGQLQQFPGAGVRWIVKESKRKLGIKKKVTSHVARHSKYYLSL